MIEVTVKHSDLIELTPGMVSGYITNKLRDAGIPVKGFFIFGGLKSGFFTQSESIDGLGIVFRWHLPDDSIQGMNVDTAIFDELNEKQNEHK